MTQMIDDPWFMIAKQRQQAIHDWADRQRLIKQVSSDCKPCRRMARWIVGRIVATIKPIIYLWNRKADTSFSVAHHDKVSGK